QAAHRWLQEQKIVRPGRTTLRDVIGTALETALENAYIQLSNTLAPGQAEKIEALLVIATPPEGDGANDGPMVPISIGVVQGHATKRITRSVVSPAGSIKPDRVLGAKRVVGAY